MNLSKRQLMFGSAATIGAALFPINTHALTPSKISFFDEIHDFVYLRFENHVKRLREFGRKTLSLPNDIFSFQEYDRDDPAYLQSFRKILNLLGKNERFKFPVVDSINEIEDGKYKLVYCIADENCIIGHQRSLIVQV